MEASSFALGKTKDDLNMDRQLLLALVREVEVIGEAASKISEESRKLSPEIPWSQVINMRNRLIHVYFDVDPDVVWDTVTMDLPILIQALQKIIRSHA